MTASELKYNHESKTDSVFFSRSSMKFFGDTMRNYYVPVGTVKITRSSGDTHTCYELQRRNPVKLGLADSAYFDVDTFERVIKPIN